MTAASTSVRMNNGNNKRNAVFKSQQGGASSNNFGSVKKMIRDTTRLLSRPNLPADVRREQERKLAALQVSLADRQKGELERQMTVKYRMVKFFERKKALRRLAAAQASGDAEEIAEAQLDLAYILHFPKDRKYIALYASGGAASCDQVLAEREAIRKQIAQKLALLGAETLLAKVNAKKALKDSDEEVSEEEEGSDDDNDDNDGSDDGSDESDDFDSNDSDSENDAEDDDQEDDSNDDDEGSFDDSDDDDDEDSFDEDDDLSYDSEDSEDDDEEDEDNEDEDDEEDDEDDEEDDEDDNDESDEESESEEEEDEDEEDENAPKPKKGRH